MRLTGTVHAAERARRPILPRYSAATWRFCAFAAMVVLAVPARADEPLLVIAPQEVMLDGRLARQQVVVTAVPRAGIARDVTALAYFNVPSPALVEVQASGVLVPRGDGTGVVTVGYGGRPAPPRGGPTPVA